MKTEAEDVVNFFETIYKEIKLIEIWALILEN